MNTSLPTRRFKWIIAVFVTTFVLLYRKGNNYPEDYTQYSPDETGKNTSTVAQQFVEKRATSPQTLVATHLSNSNEFTKSDRQPIDKKNEKTLLQSIRNAIQTPCTNISQRSEESSMCPQKSPLLVGFQLIKDTAPTLDELERKFGASLQYGGVYQPPNCQSRRKIAIVVPFRDRTAHLQAFLQHMHPFLQRQQAEYVILVVEQGDNAPFNRGKLMNVGVMEALHLFPYKCFIFHDVDLLPENDRTLYTCIDKPLNFIGQAVKGKGPHKPYYRTYFGGVAAINKNDLYKVNGFSNDYWGWGGEDDDMHRRFVAQNITCMRYMPHMAPYRMLEHLSSEPNPLRYKLLLTGVKRMGTDGLRNLKYRRLKIEQRLLYTRILVDLQPNTTILEKSTQTQLHEV